MSLDDYIKVVARQLLATNTMNNKNLSRGSIDRVARMNVISAERLSKVKKIMQDNMKMRSVNRSVLNNESSSANDIINSNLNQLMYKRW